MRKVMHFINLGLTTVLLMVLILIGFTLLRSGVSEKAVNTTRRIEDTLIETPFGAISLIREEPIYNDPSAVKAEKPFISSDGRISLRLGSCSLEFIFNANNKDEQEKEELERLSDMSLFEFISMKFRKAYGIVRGLA